VVRFVHTSDWQLGMTRHFLAPEAQARFTAARLDAVRTIGALAVAEGCPWVVVAGDVFETNHVERQVVVRALEAMGETPQVTFLLLAGNHDPLDAASVLRSRTFLEHRPPNVVVLGSGAPLSLAPGTELVAAPWPTKRPVQDLLGAAVDGLVADGVRRIAVGHGAVDALVPHVSDPAHVAAAPLDALLASGALRYVALGDRHSTTSVGSTGAVWYSGAPEPTDFDETDPGNVLVVEVGDEVRVRPIAVGTWRFEALDAELTSAADVDRLADRLEHLNAKDRTIVRLGLVGQLSLADHARLDAVLAHHRDLFAALDVWAPRSDLVRLPDDDDLASLGLVGFAADALVELRGRAHPADPDAEAAGDALALLYRLSGAAP